jgi:hypothetical protein
MQNYFSLFVAPTTPRLKQLDSALDHFVSKLFELCWVGGFLIFPIETDVHTFYPPVVPHNPRGS